MPAFVPPRDKTKTEHIGVIERLVFCSPSRDWCILSTTEGHTVIGPADGELFPRGTMWKWFGRWEDDSTRGPRFRFATYVPHLGHGKTGVTTYLSRTCDGIGAGYANRLWDKYRGDAVRVLREEPDRAAAECNISPETCHEAAAKLHVARRTESTRVELFGLFSGRGFPGHLIDRVIERFDVRGPQMIRRNPFCLLGMNGAGFKRCDKLWSDLGLPKTALKRAGLCAWNVLRNDGAGHTWIRAEDVARVLKDNCPGCDVKRALRFAIRARRLKKFKDADGVMWLAVYANAVAEERIVAALVRLSAGGNLWPTDRVPVSQTDGDRLPSQHQVERLKLATAGPVGLLLGGPGTGKSHSLAYLLREVIAEYGESNVCVACPTGKAAVRATQAIAAAGLDIRAKTMHSTLEIGRNGHDGDGWGFLRDRANPLDAKFFVIDELSMVDATLLADFLDAVPNGGHVLGVGDPYQLPPVGHGAPLRDMIAAGIPHGELTQVRRNAGQIVHACVRVKNGESFEVADQIDLNADTPKNLKHLYAKDDAQAAEVLCETLKHFTKFDPVWQTQVIVARNAKGEVSRKKLNGRLHPMLNPDGYGVEGNPFKVGDKIICLRNGRLHKVESIYGGPEGMGAELAKLAENYETVRDPDGQPEEVYVANGEIGRVVAVAARLTVARMSEGESLVKIPMGKQKDDDGEGGEEEKGRGCNFDHAYAVTCHKCQGSEAPCVIVMGDDQGGMIASREWLYTAISRASKLCILIGRMSTFDKMRGRISLHKRKTFLREMIVEAFGSTPADDGTEPQAT